jgi:hypothetical protein
MLVSLLSVACVDVDYWLLARLWSLYLKIPFPVARLEPGDIGFVFAL